MEGLVMIKASDLSEIISEIRSVKQEIRELKDAEDQLKAYSIQKTAELLDMHYNSVRKLILKGKLVPKYLDGDSGKCSIPAWSIKKYLHENL